MLKQDSLDHRLCVFLSGANLYRIANPFELTGIESQVDGKGGLRCFAIDGQLGDNAFQAIHNLDTEIEVEGHRIKAFRHRECELVNKLTRVNL
ncbi:hypothetical protein UCMB321_2070 [Pseudomonas batumici]|uniref:Uncharacterized protein n=1 Tax=Pseudomonas batumici TaxID=226910 RepID=A0A0C2IAW3_9PSED|nr:hypothetical protein UCMB321_2070 [Pseudomonas batumici]